MSDYSLLKDEDSTKQKKRITKKHLLQLLLHLFPIATWLPSYSFKILQCDIIAGITVGLMVVPQGLAYASIAQLPNQYGIPNPALWVKKSQLKCLNFWHPTKNL